MKAIAITGGVAILIIGTIIWIWFGPGEAVVAVPGAVALSLIAAWAQLVQATGGNGGQFDFRHGQHVCGMSRDRHRVSADDAAGPRVDARNVDDMRDRPGALC